MTAAHPTWTIALTNCDDTHQIRAEKLDIAFTQAAGCVATLYNTSDDKGQPVAVYTNVQSVIRRP